MSRNTNLKGSSFEIKPYKETPVLMKQVIEFLEVFLPSTLAKRLVAIILLVIGVPVKKAVELSGLSERSLWSLHKRLQEESICSMMEMKHGGGQTEKTAGLQEEIIAELETNNYHTRQEIVDMIEEKYQIKTSRTAVGRLLKKTVSNG